MRKVRKETAIIFKEICKTEGAGYIDGINNPVKIDGEVTIIYCLQKGITFKCIIDTNNIDKIKHNCTWLVNNSKLSKRPRVVHSSGHVFLYKCLVDVPNGYVVDHINRDTLDNRLCNLRVVTPGVNMLNKESYTSNSTGITNINKDGNNCKLNIVRQFNDLDIAIQAKADIQTIIDKYSNLDAAKRVV